MTASPGQEPRRWLFVLHGVYGCGRNWRLFCRQVARQRPEWGFLLVDQRGHGDSLGAPAPHGIDAMADDLVRLEQELGLSIGGVVGHSLGGKVALAYAARRADALDEVWVLDSQPGARLPESDSPAESQVMDLLRVLPETHASRNAFVAEVVRRGQSEPIAAWLAMNLRQAGSAQRLSLELDAIAAILEDYYRRDLWDELARVDARRQLHAVVAGNSPVWTHDDRDRLEALSLQNASIHPHVVEDAGHWVHVDAADAIQQMLVDHLGEV